jgi:hypothetical protein
MRCVLGLLCLSAAAAPAVYPPQIVLHGTGSTQTVIVDGVACRMHVADRKIAELAGGRIIARGLGQTWLMARCDNGAITVPVTVRPAAVIALRGFREEVVPVLIQEGCAAARCHGSPQASFHLSLFGTDAAADYRAAVRLINRRTPERSALLRKAASPVLLDWIRSGARFEAEGPRCEELRVFPANRAPRIVVGYYSDGSIRDLTPEAMYQTKRAGEVVVRAAGCLAVAATADQPLLPSSEANDNDFIARIYRDTLGRVPTEEEAQAFLIDKAAGKRNALIRRLTDQPEFSRRWAAEFMRVLGTTPGLNPPGLNPMDVPYDRFVGGLLRSRTIGAAAAGRFLLGIRLDCARCHNHPDGQWTKADYQGFEAFFTGKGTPRFPGVDAAAGDPMESLSEWLTRSDNAYVAPAIVNRVWHFYTGRGFVEPLEETGELHAPDNPALFRSLVTGFVQSGFDLRRLARTILMTRQYASSSRVERRDAPAIRQPSNDGRCPRDLGI